VISVKPQGAWHKSVYRRSTSGHLEMDEVGRAADASILNPPQRPLRDTFGSNLLTRGVLLMLATSQGATEGAAKWSQGV
jgi:hypothetical protein